MRNIFLFFVLFFFATVAHAETYVFQGSWKTTANRKLDGTMTCDVIRTAKDKWTGKFYGVWQGVEFSYDVKFSGPPNELKGKATIDGASYDWTGSIDKEKFKGTYTGSRYTGSFDLTRKK